MNRRADVLAQPAFAVALALLLANDFYFKAHYPGWITGKLSDFAGLYVFVQFVAAVTGFRVARMAVATAVLFAMWKSPLSIPLIDAVNGIAPWPIHRTIDPTDLIAFAVLPLAVRMYEARTRWTWSLLRYPVGLLAAFAITATSVMTPTHGSRFELADPVEPGAPISETFARVDTLMASRGFTCEQCVSSGAYIVYRKGLVSIQLHYDAAGKRLYGAANTIESPTMSPATEAVQRELLDLLRTRFRSLTYQSSSPPNELQSARTPPRWEIRVEYAEPKPADECPPAAVIAAAQIPGDAQSPNCRMFLFGRVTGPQEYAREVRIQTRTDGGSVAHVLRIYITGDYEHPGESIRFVERFEPRLRAAAGKNAVVSIIRDGT